jgi:hypothetical protein
VHERALTGMSRFGQSSYTRISGHGCTTEWNANLYNSLRWDFALVQLQVVLGQCCCCTVNSSDEMRYRSSFR